MSEEELDQILAEMQSRRGWLRGAIDNAEDCNQRLALTARRNELDDWRERLQRVRGSDEEEG